MPNGGYKLSMYFNSDSPLEYLKDGQAELTYDAQLSSWTMIAKKSNRSEWFFCSPSEGLDLMTAALDCYASTMDAQDVGYAGAANLLKGSIEMNKEGTVSRAHLYTQRADCSVNMPELRDDWRYDAWTTTPTF